MANIDHIVDVMPKLGKRTYNLDVSLHHRVSINGDGHIVITNARIRETMMHLFRSWFGHAPNESYHFTGYAGAWDSRGNRITLEQLNLHN